MAQNVRRLRPATWSGSNSHETGPSCPTFPSAATPEFASGFQHDQDRDNPDQFRFELSSWLPGAEISEWSKPLAALTGITRAAAEGRSFAGLLEEALQVEGLQSLEPLSREQYISGDWLDIQDSLQARAERSIHFLLNQEGLNQEEQGTAYDLWNFGNGVPVVVPCCYPGIYVEILMKLVTSGKEPPAFEGNEYTVRQVPRLLSPALGPNGDITRVVPELSDFPKLDYDPLVQLVLEAAQTSDSVAALKESIAGRADDVMYMLAEFCQVAWFEPGRCGTKRVFSRDYSSMDSTKTIWEGLVNHVGEDSMKVKVTKGELSTQLNMSKCDEKAEKEGRGRNILLGFFRDLERSLGTPRAVGLRDLGGSVLELEVLSWNDRDCYEKKMSNVSDRATIQVHAATSVHALFHVVSDVLGRGGSCHAITAPLPTQMCSYDLNANRFLEIISYRNLLRGEEQSRALRPVVQWLDASSCVEHMPSGSGTFREAGPHVVLCEFSHAIGSILCRPGAFLIIENGFSRYSKEQRVTVKRILPAAECRGSNNERDPRLPRAMRIVRDGERSSGEKAQESLRSETGKMAAESCPLTIQRTQAHFWQPSGWRPLSWITERWYRRVMVGSMGVPSVELHCAALNLALGGHSAKTSLGGGVASSSESEWLLQPDPVKNFGYESGLEEEDGEGGVDTDLPYMLSERSCPICRNAPELYYYD